jgi:hypothetical protein
MEGAFQITVQLRSECASCAQHARAMAREAGWSPTDAEGLVLVVMELATDAILASGEGLVSLEIEPRRWMVEVINKLRPGSPPRPDASGLHSRTGLSHVSRLSTHFTLEALPDGGERAVAVCVR